MERNRIAYLLQQYEGDRITVAEREELYALLCSFENSEDILGWLEDSYQQTLPQPIDTAHWRPVLNHILQQEEQKIVSISTVKVRWVRWAAAAAVLLIVLTSVILVLSRPGHQLTPVAQTQQQRFKNDVAPGNYKAKLTLADGSVIILDSANAGQLATQGNTVVLNKEGKLIYQKTNPESQVFYNTLATAKGETYATVLADGTKVWLNAASSIKFPASFTGNERRVEVTGEAYFEVAHNAGKPFIVTKGTTEVTVLGTHFNVNAYEEEEMIRVTLLEGSVEVGNRESGVGSQRQKVRIKPGEQAALSQKSNSSTQITVQTPDLGEVMAWKNGRFYFEGATIQTIMRQVERWYNVQVVYQDAVNYSFVAKVSRDVPVSELLKLLELTNGVHFKIEGRRIIVMR